MGCNNAHRKTSIGGQALIEGVMMRGPKKTAMAVRLQSGKIVLDEWENDLSEKPKFFKLPVIRGVFNFIDSMMVGYKVLMRSAELSEYNDKAAEEAIERAKQERIEKAERGESDGLTTEKISKAFIYIGVYLFLFALIITMTGIFKSNDTWNGPIKICAILIYAMLLFFGVDAAKIIISKIWKDNGSAEAGEGESVVSESVKKSEAEAEGKISASDTKEEIPADREASVSTKEAEISEADREASVSTKEAEISEADREASVSTKEAENTEEEADISKNAKKSKSKSDKKASKKKADEDDDDEPLSSVAMGIIMLISSVLAIALSVGLFMWLPTFLYNLLKENFAVLDNRFLQSLFEGILKILIFLVYMILISQTKDIKRVFMYHGAEHKTIFCYEKYDELTVANVKKQSRFHPRCGTSFIVLMLIISILVGLLIPHSIPSGLRTVLKLCCLPLTMGLGYEVIKLAGRSDNPVVKLISKPGLWMQRISTKEPEEDYMMECAIMAFKAVVPEDDEDIIK